MSVPISNVTRRVVLAASGTGPYSFNFEILANTDVSVYKDDDLLTLTTDYTVTINTNGTGFVTLTANPVGATQIAIVGDRAIQRTSDFTTGGDLFAATLNQELDSLTIFSQQNAESVDRALKAPQTDPTTIDMTLPRAADRAGKYLAFDSNGNPEPGDTAQEIADVAANIDNINIVKGQITPVNNIATVAAADANITAVAGSIANVNSVGGSIASVNSVAGQLGTGGDITTVAADLEGVDTIGTVAGSITDINALGPIAANITTVAGISADVTTVAGDATDIGIVAGIATDVSTVAGIATDVSAVENIAANVTTVAGISSNVTTVAGVAANVTTVAGISANVTTVAGISADVTTVAGDSADIQLLADNIGAIATKANAGANSDITSLTGLTTPLSVPQGGTGAATLAGAGIAQLAVAQTFSAKQTFTATQKIQQTLEKMTVSATAATGTINYDCLTQAALYYTTDASGNFTVNFRGDGSTSLDTMMATGESLTIAFLVTNGATPYYNSAVQVDGNSVTPKWQGGTAPTSGNASGIDAYVYNIVKTGSATFTVFASQTQFK